MKFPTIRRFEILPLLSNHTVLKYASTDTGSETSNERKKANVMRNYDEEIKFWQRKKQLPEKKIQDLGSITGIAVAYNCVSWAKISVLSTALLNWESQALPNLQKPLNEIHTLEVAHNVLSDLPASDLYVLEGAYKKAFYSNDTSLKSMLMALLSSRYGNSCEILAVLNPKILNSLHNLLIGGERISPTEIIRKKGLLAGKVQTSNQCKNESSAFSRIDLEPEHLKFFADCTEAKQGGLSLSLLIALTFIDLNTRSPETDYDNNSSDTDNNILIRQST